MFQMFLHLYKFNFLSEQRKGYNIEFIDDGCQCVTVEHCINCYLGSSEGTWYSVKHIFGNFD